MNQLLEVRNLSVQFRTSETQGISSLQYTTAVDNVSFSIGKGETLGIVGESGSGKSVTCLSILNLLSYPQAIIPNGEILFSGQPTANNDSTNLLKLSLKEIRKFRGKDIAMIFQEPMTSLNPVFTCGSQVAEVIRLHQKVSQKTAKLLTIQLFEEVMLPRPENIFSSYPHQLSGGQKQRVMIAMAISCKPSLLIADEPTTALDVTVQKTILELLKSLQVKYGMSIIFITHDLGVIAGIADRVLVMYKGKIVEQGKANDIFHNPQHPYTKGLIACRPSLNEHRITNNEQRIKILPTISDFMSDTAVRSQQSAVSKQLSAISYQVSKDVILEVKNLKNYFPIGGGFFKRQITNYIKAVDEVNFEVFRGETLGLVGESGCGKTTLGRTVLRLLLPTSGEVIYKGRNIADISREEMRRLRKDIQIIFQDPYSSLNPHISVGNAIVEPMRVHGILNNDRERKQKVIEILEKVNLNEGHFSRYPHEFSGGQRQRICIARALALEPQFIVCDECVSALDVSVQAQVLNLLNQLKREYGFTYIFISHDLSVVKFMSDRIIVMKDGKIVEIGNSDEVYNNPQTEYTKKLIESIPQVI